jgi:TatD DNase family protein
MYQNIPLEKMLVETDAPYLTPHPLRGKMNKPEYVRLVVEFWSQKRGISFDEFAKITKQNTQDLFGV